MMLLLPKRIMPFGELYYERGPYPPSPLRVFVRRIGRAAALSLLLVAATSGAAIASGGVQSPWLPSRKAIAAPAGFGGICARYDWACGRSGRSIHSMQAQLDLANTINVKINRQVRQISDRNQYGVEEVWALPTVRGGDCEDIVLLKKQHLIQQGVAADRLLIATVLDRNRAPHAVLVLRLEAGDYVLDSLKNQIKPWHKTGYSFLRMQNPKAPQTWDAVMAGGMFDKRKI